MVKRTAMRSGRQHIPPVHLVRIAVLAIGDAAVRQLVSESPIFQKLLYNTENAISTLNDCPYLRCGDAYVL